MGSVPAGDCSTLSTVARGGGSRGAGRGVGGAKCASQPTALHRGVGHVPHWRESETEQMGRTRGHGGSEAEEDAVATSADIAVPLEKAAKVRLRAGALGKRAIRGFRAGL